MSGGNSGIVSRRDEQSAAKKMKQVGSIFIGLLCITTLEFQSFPNLEPYPFCYKDCHWPEWGNVQFREPPGLKGIILVG